VVGLSVAEHNADDEITSDGYLKWRADTRADNRDIRMENGAAASPEWQSV